MIIPARRRSKGLTMEQAFDEWMRCYSENPEQFENTMSSLHASHRKATPKSKHSEYGAACAALLRGLITHGKKHWDRKPRGKKRG